MVLIANGKIQGEVFTKYTSYLSKGELSEIYLFSQKNEQSSGYIGYVVININDYANIREDIPYDITMTGNGYKISKHPTDKELYIIEYLADNIVDGNLTIKHKDVVVNVAVVNREGDV